MGKKKKKQKKQEKFYANNRGLHVLYLVFHGYECLGFFSSNQVYTFGYLEVVERFACLTLHKVLLSLVCSLSGEISSPGVCQKMCFEYSSDCDAKLSHIQSVSFPFECMGVHQDPSSF